MSSMSGSNVLSQVQLRPYSAPPSWSRGFEPDTSHDLYQRVVSGDLDAAVVTRPPFNLPKSCDWHTFRDEPLVLLSLPG
jgi:DNA-binding transcriptional LysR family regulator